MTSSSIASSRHVFGPVRSGRLGLSLGLDLLGARICTFDCLYCEVGPTDALTTARKPYVRAGVAHRELAAHRASRPGETPDAVTLGGMGEPCLNTELAAMIEAARDVYPMVPTAVLTNSSLLSDESVRRSLLGADVVLPSMDTLVEAEYALLNRPHPEISLYGMRQGLLSFRNVYSGRLFLEILLADGINDTEDNLAALHDFCRDLRPDRVDVTTLSRPGAHPGAKRASEAALERFRRVLGADRSATPDGHGPSSGRSARGEEPADLGRRIVEAVARRPQTEAQLARALGAAPGAVRAALTALTEAGAVKVVRELDTIFFAGTGR